MTLVLSLVLLLAFSFFGLAESSESTQLKEQVASVKAKILGDSQKSRKVMAGLYSLQKSLRKASRSRSDVEDEVVVLDSSVKNISKVVSGLTEETGEKRKILREKFVALYKMGGRGFLGALFGHESASELERNIRIVNSVMANDMELLATYRDNIDLMNHKKNVLVSRKKELDKKKSQARALEQKLEKQVELKRRIVRSLKRSRSRDIEKLASYREVLNSQMMPEAERGVLRTLLNPSVFEEKGHLPRPVVGYPTLKFGMAEFASGKIRIRNKGQFFSSTKSETVSSVFSGDVVFASRFPGRSYTVIIDHGAHFFSVYSNLRTSLLREGQYVRKGEEIGHTGFDVIRSSYGLHFEFRHFSDPQDPSDWLVPSSKRKISSYRHEGEK